MSRRGVPSRMWLKQGGGKVWFDPAANASRFGEIEAGIRERVHGFIEEMLK